MSELEPELTNKFGRIELTRDQTKELNSVLTSKDFSNDYKRKTILRFRGTCSICNIEPSLYALINRNNDQVLERYCPDCFDTK